MAEPPDPCYVCDCVDVCKIPVGQPQPIASCQGFEHQTVPPAAPVRRLYDALYAMMLGWEDDDVRLEAFAALKEASDWLFAADWLFKEGDPTERRNGGTV